jgi:hypothetical protein
MPRMIREYGAAGGGAVPPTQPKKRPLPPKLFGGWTATLEDPGSYQSRTIDRAEDVLGGEEAIDETQPKEIFKGLNRSEQQKRAMELRKLSMTGGVPMRESTSPRLGSNRWWNNINEKVTNNPEIGKFFSEQIDKVLVNEKAGGVGGGGGGDDQLPWGVTPRDAGRFDITDQDKPDYDTSWSLGDSIGYGLQHLDPAVWWGQTDPYVLPNDPDEKLLDHGHWVYHNGSWYFWRPGIGGADGHWQRFTNTDEYLPPFDGPPPIPNNPGKGVSIEHPRGSGVWFEWEPDPTHPDGGVFTQPWYVDPATGEPGTHPASPNYNPNKPGGGGSRY